MHYLDLLPSTRAFTLQEALSAGLTRYRLSQLVQEAMVTSLFRGLYIRYDVELTVARRAAAIALVTPRDAVATDETAAWIHGVDLYAGPPRLQFFQPGAHDRLRNSTVDSGSRRLAVTDVVAVDGVRLTTPLRTAVDLARLRRPPRAIASVDGLLRLETFTMSDLERELERFKGYRGIVQARWLVPLADARSESPAESRLRYEWIRSRDLPRPEPQLKVWTPFSSEPWRLDLGLEDLKYAAEYDGEKFHSTDEQRERDRFRRTYLREVRGWTIDVLTKPDVYPRTADPMVIIRAGIRRARRAAGEPRETWRWPGA